MVSRHKLAHTAAGWQSHTAMSKEANDPLIQADPWAAGKDVVQTVVGAFSAEEAHPFERHKLATRFIGPDGNSLPQVPRWEARREWQQSGVECLSALSSSDSSSGGRSRLGCDS